MFIKIVSFDPQFFLIKVISFDPANLGLTVRPVVVYLLVFSRRFLPVSTK